MNLSSIGVKLDRWEKLLANSNNQHIRIEGSSIYFLDGTNRVYHPSPTMARFHESTKFVRELLGPYGSGKSTGDIMEIILQAYKMPKCIDGIRRAKWAIIRNTSGELETSTYKSWMDWFDTLGTIKRRKKPVLTLEHRYNDGRGIVDLELIFLACDREEDLKKLKSTEFTGSYLNEACELPQALLDVIKGRVGRYPAKHICPEPFWWGVIMDTNPPDTDHWLYRLFEIDKPDNYEIFKQPSGLVKDEKGIWHTNPNADNIKHLPEGYYERLAHGANDEFIKVYCCGEYGIVRTGKPVYPQYNDDIHSVEHIELEKGHPVYFGWDFGLTPAFICAQYIEGQLRIIKEFPSDNTRLEDLIEYSVRPWINANCQGWTFYSDGDPADSELLHYYQTLDAKGIPTDKALTNEIIPRLDAVKSFMSKLAMGKPAFVVSRSGCPYLRKGLLGEYQYKRVRVLTEERYKDEPHKTHPISDLQDALQYICLRINDQYEIKTPVDVKSLMDNKAFI